MWKAQLKDIDPTAASAAASIFSTVLTHHLSSRQSELCSELLCWIFLPVFFAIANRSGTSIFPGTVLFSKLGSKSESSYSLWVVAASVATACAYKAEIGTIGLFPTLTPILLIAEKHLGTDLHTSRTLEPWFSYPLVNTVSGASLAALITTFTLSNRSLLEYALSTILIISLLIVYVALSSCVKKDGFLPTVNFNESIVPLSLRVAIMLIGLLGAQMATFGSQSNNIQLAFSLGLTKASSWYFTFQTAKCGSWLIATAIATFSIVSTRDPFLQSSEIRAFLHVIASFIVLSQIIHMLPTQMKARSALWAFWLVSLVPYLANVYAIRNAQTSAPSSFGHSQTHPVEALIRTTKPEFEILLQRQSKNYTAAYEEYQRRYGLNPPPGFEGWYNFAVSHQSPIIDNFDTIFDNISPFWSLSGEEITGIISDVQKEPDSELWRCNFSGESARTHCRHPNRTFDRNFGLLFDKLLEDLRGVLPDLKILVNHLDEPRVMLPAKSLQGYSNRKNQFQFTDISGQPSWDLVTEFCAPQQINRSARTEQMVKTFALPFVTDSLSAIDLCRHPEYSAMHGLLMCPTSLSLIKGLVPVFSTGALSTMGDILFPSPAYMEPEFRYDETHDIDWDRKQNNLYWAGSTTGGFALDGQWQSYQRQRFVKLAQNLERQYYYYLREKNGVVSRVKSLFLNSRLFDVSFTKIFQCTRKYCRDQRSYFNMKPWADKDQALQSRLVFDIDGNGISGRYYKLLASKSVPLKHTLLREWHDERLMPWVHYIPISQGMEEVPELVFYLTSTEAGQQRAREIAEQGRDWFSKAFRDVDLTIYTYRLLLELARLQDPNRPAS